MVAGKDVGRWLAAAAVKIVIMTVVCSCGVCGSTGSAC